MERNESGSSVSSPDQWLLIRTTLKLSVSLALRENPTSPAQTLHTPSQQGLSFISSPTQAILCGIKWELSTEQALCKLWAKREVSPQKHYQRSLTQPLQHLIFNCMKAARFRFQCWGARVFRVLVGAYVPLQITHWRHKQSCGLSCNMRHFTAAGLGF